MKTRRIQRMKRQTRRYTGGARKSPLGVFEMENYKETSPARASQSNSPRAVEILSPRTRASDPRSAQVSPLENAPASPVAMLPTVHESPIPGAIWIPGKEPKGEYVFLHGRYIPVASFAETGPNKPNAYFNQEIKKWELAQHRLLALKNQRAWLIPPSHIPGIASRPSLNPMPRVRVLTPPKRSPINRSVLKMINQYGYIPSQGNPQYRLPYTPLSKTNLQKHLANVRNTF